MEYLQNSQLSTPAGRQQQLINYSIAKTIHLLSNEHLNQLANVPQAMNYPVGIKALKPRQHDKNMYKPKMTPGLKFQGKPDKNSDTSCPVLFSELLRLSSEHKTLPI